MIDSLRLRARVGLLLKMLDRLLTYFSGVIPFPGDHGLERRATQIAAMPDFVSLQGHKPIARSKRIKCLLRPVLIKPQIECRAEHMTNQVNCDVTKHQAWIGKPLRRGILQAAKHTP